MDQTKLAIHPLAFEISARAIPIKAILPSQHYAISARTRSETIDHLSIIMTPEIRIDDLRGPEIAELLQEHLDEMYRFSPPESVHALDLASLRQPEITFWTAWDQSDLMGCIALKALSPTEGEIKSMRTGKSYLRRGVAAALLDHLLIAARDQDYQRLLLETGSPPEFEPARKLYSRFGFAVCGPFAGYRKDPNSVFMQRRL